MRRHLIEYILVFVLALTVRLLLFYPGFIQGGDIGQFSTFVREIYLIGGGVPATNTLYFPGTTYIYPPFLFMLIFWLTHTMNVDFNAYVVMRAMLVIAVIASSVTAGAIYGFSRGDVIPSRRLVIAIVAVFFMPDLYALSWGGDPFVFAECFFVLMLYSLSRRSERSLLWIATATVLSVLIAASHDLTWFSAMFTFLIILIYDAVKGRRAVLARELIPFGAGSAVGLIWWVPRIKFVYDALFVTESSGYGPLSSIASAGSYILVFVPFALAILAISVFALYRSNIKLTQLEWDPFIIALVSSTVFVVFMFKSPTLGGRLMYVSIILASIVVLRMYGTSTGPQARKEPSRQVKKSSMSVPLALLIAAVVVTVPFQTGTAVSSVHHYKSGYYYYDQQLLNWGKSNFTNGTVVAPNIGNYISSVDGVPVIVYGNFLVGGGQIEQRNAAASVLLNPGSQNSVSILHQYGIRYIVVNTTALHEGSGVGAFPSSMYQKVFSDPYYTVEKYVAS